MSDDALPLVKELTPVPDVMAAVRAFDDLPGLLLLESALIREHVGRYSFLTADPFYFERLPRAEFGVDPLAKLRDRTAAFAAETVPGLPPFQGGAAGLLSYELGHAWEKLSFAGRDEFELPALAVGLYDWVLAWDHVAHRAWVISQGFPETDRVLRTERAGKRLREVCARLEASTAIRATPPLPPLPKGGKSAPPLRKGGQGGSRGALPTASIAEHVLTPDDIAPHFPAAGPPGLLSNFSRDGYLRAVERAIEYIRAGDIFQVNLSQRLLFPMKESPLDLYARLREKNPAPFAGYFACDEWAIASASPERFVCVHGDEVETRPIKGTRRRQRGPEADLYTRDELRESEKDQAENVMIVDLLRNDLSRVCRAGTICVPHLCRVETYETVQHLVSEIRGRLTAGRTAWDLVPAVFPGGSITGAPKVRAMEIIAELEPTARGPYCGNLFYIGFDGAMDSSILIRTFTARRGWIQCPVGGGIVAQSDPVAEYEETLHKAEGMLRALDW